MFSSTQEAVRFGLRASEVERMMLASLRIRFMRKFEDAMSRNAFDQALIFATKAQFCREALEADKIVAQNPEFF